MESHLCPLYNCGVIVYNILSWCSSQLPLAVDFYKERIRSYPG